MTFRPFDYWREINQGAGVWKPPASPGTMAPQVRFGRATGDAVYDAYELERLRGIEASVRATAIANYNEWKPALDMAASAAAMTGSGPNAVARATLDAATQIAAMFPPFGTAVGCMLKAIGELLFWLQSKYPATAVQCLPELSNAVIGGASNAARVYRDERKLYIGTIMNRGTSIGTSYNIASNGENFFWSDVNSGLPEGRYPAYGRYAQVPRFDVGTPAERLNELWKVCAPQRRFLVGPPAGYLLWGQYLLAFPDTVGASAAINLGVKIRDKFVQDAKPVYVGKNYMVLNDGGDGCWTGGYLYSIKGFPNETLLNVLRWITTQTTEGQEVAREELFSLEPPASGPETTPAMYWADGLTEAAKWFIGWSKPQYKTYHAKALIDEYNDRKADGRIGPLSTIVPHFPNQTISKKLTAKSGTSPAVIIGGTVVGGGILYALGKWLFKWW